MAKQGNWIRQQAVYQETREREKSRKEALAKLFHDYSKLCFAGLVIGGVSPVFTDVYYEGNMPYVFIGLIISVILAIVGNNIYKKI